MAGISPYGESNDPVDYSNEVDYGNGGFDGFTPANDDGSTSRLSTLTSGFNLVDTLKTAATGAVGGAVVSSVFGGSTKTGAIVGASLAVLTGGENPLSAVGGAVGSVVFGSGGQSPSTFTGGGSSDWRVRVSVSSSMAASMYSGLMTPLAQTNGFIFSTTPQVTVNHQASYNSYNLIHNNYKAYTYSGSEVSAISITGDVHAQTVDEANYINAGIHFFRSCTKMFFGQSPNAGNPPPMVFLNGYGGFYLPNVPCVVSSFNHTMPNEVDFIKSGNTWVPISSNFQITLLPVYSRQKQLQFSNEQYNTGGYVINGGDTGGFL